MENIFKICLILILYTYFGYPLILAMINFIYSKPVKKGEEFPSITIFISAYNEEDVIEARVNNLLESDYPRDKMEIIVGSDGSTDKTYQIVKRLCEENKIRYAVSFQRAGKPSMLNLIAKDARGDVYVFADARQKFAKDALKNLVAPFADENVGAVSGELIIEDKETGTGKGIGLYWNYEKFLRKLESNIGSTLGATGAIYAIRKELFRYLPDVILDDVFVPMNAIMQGKRVIFEPSAKAFDMVSKTSKIEFSRKVRTLVGNFEIFKIFTEALNPFRSSIAFQLISHKFLRLVVPYLLILLVISNIFLFIKGGIYFLAGFLQLSFYAVAYLGFISERSGARTRGASRLFFVPFEFCMFNVAAIAALMTYLSGRKTVRWEKMA